MMKNSRLSSSENVSVGTSYFMSPANLVRIILIGALLICGITFAVYFPSTENAFVNWDDDKYVDNSYLGKPVQEFIKIVFTSFYLSNWHPLTMLSLKLDHFFYGMNAYGFHLTNIVLHVVNTFLVMCFMGYLFYKSVDQMKTGHVIAIFFIGLVFGLHPIHVESVTWISERKDVLYSFFWLVGLLAYLRYISVSGKKEKYFYYVLCLGLFFLSFSSKAMAVTFPGVLLIIDYYFLRIQKKNLVKIFLLEKFPFYLLQLSFVMLTILGQSRGDAIATLTIDVRLLRAVRGLAFYLVKFLLPVNLSPLYLSDIQKPLWHWEYLVSIVLFIGITIVVLWSMKRTRVLMSLWAYYLITLSPVIGIIQIGTQAAADRYMYLPMLGPLTASTLALNHVLFRKVRWSPVAVFFVGITAVLSFLTVTQIHVWKDSIRLWTRAASLAPDFAYPLNLLATTHFNAGKLDEAIEIYKQSLGKKHSSVKFDANSYYNLGLIYYQKKMYAEALSNLSMSVMLRPDNADAYNNIGVIFSDNKDLDKAIHYYTLALQYDPDNTTAYFNLGEAYAMKGMTDKAVDGFSSFLRLSWNLYEAHIKIARVYRDVKLPDKALEHYKAALAMNPDSELVSKEVRALTSSVK